MTQLQKIALKSVIKELKDRLEVDDYLDEVRREALEGHILTLNEITLCE